MRDVTIGVVARDRFSTAAHSLTRLLDATPGPFRLIIVDAGTPARYRAAMELAVAGRPEVWFLRHPVYLNPNAAKNLIIREGGTDGEFLVLLENDNLVSPGWLDLLIRACDEEDADVARPMMLERRLGRTFAHFDERWDRIDSAGTPVGTVHRLRPRTTALSDDLGAPRQKTQVLEVHCVLFRRPVFDRIGLLDERINTRQEIDLALQLHTAGVPVVFEPAARVTYISPPPVRRDEREFYRFRWDPEGARRSHRIIEEKWNLENLPSSMDFVINRREFESYAGYARFFLRWELPAYARYGAYRLASHLPARVGGRLQRALYG